MLETVAAPLKAAEFEAFRSGLEGLGYVEPRDVKIEYRSADGHPDRFTTLAQELIDLKVDLITTRGTPAAFAAKNSTKKPASRLSWWRSANLFWSLRASPAQGATLPV